VDILPVSDKHGLVIVPEPERSEGRVVFLRKNSDFLDAYEKAVTIADFLG
jgi:hypothetical protein